MPFFWKKKQKFPEIVELAEESDEFNKKIFVNNFSNNTSLKMHDISFGSLDTVI